MSSNSKAQRMRIKFLPHLNSTWVGEDMEAINSDDVVLQLFERLKENQEVQAIGQKVFYF